jgi:uncharacterized protein with PIN domain
VTKQKWIEKKRVEFPFAEIEADGSLKAMNITDERGKITGKRCMKCGSPLRKHPDPSVDGYICLIDYPECAPTCLRSR